jgi:hypothetical protein
MVKVAAGPPSRPLLGAGRRPLSLHLGLETNSKQPRLLAWRYCQFVCHAISGRGSRTRGRLTEAVALQDPVT